MNRLRFIYLDIERHFKLFGLFLVGVVYFGPVWSFHTIYLKRDVDFTTPFFQRFGRYPNEEEIDILANKIVWFEHAYKRQQTEEEVKQMVERMEGEQL